MDVKLGPHAVGSREGSLGTAAVCASVAAVLFHFYGNSAAGYIKSSSLFYWWGFQWTNPASETEHGWLILGLSAWLLWRNLRVVERGPRNGHSGEAEFSAHRAPSGFAAAAAMFAGLALHALGFAAQQARISIVALLIFTWGVLRLGGGRRWGAAAMFPLAFMVFAIPINVLDSLGFWLRVWVVDASAAIAHAAGVNVLQSGTQLVAPDGRYNYDVAAACSGVRSLTAMAALSLLAGYLNFQAWWRRALVFLLCFPLVYVGNVTRIVSIIFAGQIGGQKWGERMHDVMGFGVFAIVLGGVLAGIGALRRWWPEDEVLLESAEGTVIRTAERELHVEVGPAVPNRPELSDASRPIVDVNPGRLGTAGPTLAAAVIAIFALGEMTFLHHLVTSPARGEVGIALAADGQNPVELPSLIGIEWAGRSAPVSPIEREILPPDTGYSRKRYVALGQPEPEVFFSIVLSGRDRTSIHRPELCLIGQGWTIAEHMEHRFKFPPSRGANPPKAAPARADFPVTLLRVRREVMTAQGKVVRPELVAYWFIGGDTIVASHWQRILRDSWNRVRHARADRWAYVLMQTDAGDGEAAALARMQAVLDGALPVFQPALARR